VHTVNITAVDEGDLTDSRMLTFTILLPPNQPPTITNLSIPLSGQEVMQGVKFTITGRVVDDYGVSMILVSKDGSIPTYATLEGENWWYEFRSDWVGDHEVNFTARDVSGAESSLVVTITVIERDEEETQSYMGVVIAIIVVLALVVVVALFMLSRSASVPPPEPEPEPRSYLDGADEWEELE
jgi:hypothetical protein